VGGGPLREVHDVGQAEVVDEEATDGDFGSDVDEDADSGHEQIGLLPDAADSATGEFAGAEVAGEVSGGKLDEADGDG